MSAALRTLLLGGTGHFGSRIARRLRAMPGIELVLAGRDAAKLATASAALGVEGVALDRDDRALAARLHALAPGLVISTAGPFQSQDYRVARAAMAAAAHYVDIADGRGFVCGIRALHAEALERGVCVISGASSVPTLSFAVIERLCAGVAAVDAIDIGITTSSRPPGDATVRAVLRDCGQPVPQWRDGHPVAAYGSQGAWRRTIAGAGRRRFFPCDVPDLQLLHERFPTLRSLRFGAGSELGAVHLGLGMLALAVRSGLVKDAAALAPALIAVGRALQRFGTGTSAMYVRISGRSDAGVALSRAWELVAASEHGADIPGLAVACLARKLAAGALAASGAFTGAGLVTLDEYLREMDGLDIRTRFVEPRGEARRLR